MAERLCAAALVVVPGDARAREREDRHARFRECYDAHWAEIAAYAYQLTRNTETAHDLTQEAFTRLLVKWSSVQEPRAYLFRTVSNLVSDAWRQALRQRRLHRLIRTDDVVSGPDRTIADAVGRLPRRQRDAVLLHYYADLPVSEIAIVLDRPAGTVKWLLAEARRRLARVLEDSGE